jgi:transposase
VHRILQEAELRPHKVKMWCTSNDPDYDAKRRDVTRLYLHPPEGEAVVCFDEKSQMQARSRRVPLRLSTLATAGRQESDYIRHGTSCLLACFDVRSGQVIGRLSPQRRAVEFLSFLDVIAAAYPKGRVHVVLDNLNTHKGAAVDAWNRKHGGRFVFHFTPFHASWLNQIEVYFSILERRILKHGEFASTKELDAAVERFLHRWNRCEAHPFRWTYRAKRRVA